MANGIYVLVISVDKNVRINVGALGSVFFEKGLYAYVGSAQNNLKRRLERHLTKVKRKFWHVDYLLCNDVVKVLRGFHRKAEKYEECQIALKMNKRGIAIKGFGSSNCRCVSHLFKLKSYRFLREFMHETALLE